ncbi:hypothetical protein MRX96_058483 [Rhipicephalus microplus]
MTRRKIMSNACGREYERLLVETFLKADKHSRGLININQHGLALFETGYPRHRAFRRKTITLLMAMVNRSYTGLLIMEQFFRLHQTVRCWSQPLRMYDDYDGGCIRHMDVRATMGFID